MINKFVKNKIKKNYPSILFMRIKNSGRTGQRFQIFKDNMSELKFFLIAHVLQGIQLAVQ